MRESGVSIFRDCRLWNSPVFDAGFQCQLGAWQSQPPQAAAGDSESSLLLLPAAGTHYGFVQSGSLQLNCQAGEFQLREGMYFAVPGSAELRTEGTGFVASRLDYSGFLHIGGPVEQAGRLRYIDGCSDSLLIPPVVLGDPCLNLLFLPPDTRQTRHTHPSCRLGIILSGHGICRTGAGEIELQPGYVFHIPAQAEHSFHTDKQALRVIAWHPDSDCGPVHHNHPMINRTIIDGISAAGRRP